MASTLALLNIRLPSTPSVRARPDFANGANRAESLAKLNEPKATSAVKLTKKKRDTVNRIALLFEQNFNLT
jgi:hypothetical protein